MSKTDNYPITVGEINTSIQVTHVPDTPVPVGGYSSFRGKLVDQWGTGLGGMPMYAKIDGTYSFSFFTSGTGDWSYSFSLAAGTHTIYAYFSGNVQYKGSNTPTYTVVFQKTATTMNVTTPPPATVAPGGTILFAGNLKAGTIGLTGEPINLMVDGAKVGSTTTGTGGAWTFSFTLVTGSHTVYAEYPGSATYAGCDIGEELDPTFAANFGTPSTPVLICVGVAALAIAGIAIRLRRK
jgi:hypothetical protein